MKKASAIPEILFGVKDVFAIELASVKPPQKYRMCFWVNNVRVGSFTKAWELKFAEDAIHKFRTNYESYSDPAFDQMSGEQLVKYMVSDLFDLTEDDDQEEYNKRMSYYLFWGPQFSNDGCDIIVLSQNDKIRFVYRPAKTKIYHDNLILTTTFNKVFDEFLKFAATVVP